MKKIVLTNRYKIPISMVALFLILSESFFVSFQDRYSVLLILLFLLGIMYFVFEGIKHIPKINKYELVWLVCIIIVACNNCFLEYGEKSYPICFFSMGIFILCSKYSTYWEKSLLNLIPRMMLFYSISTIVLFILPQSVYYKISNILFNNIAFGGISAGLTIHYSTNGMYIAMGICMYFTMYINEIKNKKRKKYFFAFFICISALLMTGKRGPLIAVIFACFLIFIITSRGKPNGRTVKIIYIIVILGIVLLVLSFFIPELGNTFKRFTNGSDNLSNGRDLLYKNAVEIFKKNPILGIGWNKFKYIQTAMIFSNKTNIHDVHNIYLQLLCESGIVGFISFMIGFTYTINLSLKFLEDFRIKKDEINYKIFSISIVLQCFFLLYGLTGNPLYDETMMIPYFILIAIVNKNYYLKN